MVDPKKVIDYLIAGLRASVVELRARELALARFREAYPEEAHSLDVLLLGARQAFSVLEIDAKFVELREKLDQEQFVLLSPKEVEEFWQHQARTSYKN